MTVLIGYADKENHTCYVGGDYGVSFFGSYRLITDTPKVFHYRGLDNVIIACSGSIRMCNLIYADTNIFPDKFNPCDIDLKYITRNIVPVLKKYSDTLEPNDNAWDIIMAVKDRLFVIQGDCSVFEMNDDHNLVTLGSGCETAYGAMSALLFMNKRTKIYSIDNLIAKAIDITADFNMGISHTKTILRTQ